MTRQFKPGQLQTGSLFNISSSYALTASFALNAQTSSYINPTFISQSAAASGFGAGVTYISASNSPLTEIEVADYDNSVAVTFVNGKLKFIFGTPTAPTSVAASLSGFVTDRFNNVNDAYSVNGTWNNQEYTLVSASLYTGSALLAQVGSGTSLTYVATTSGSQTYRLEYTASSPLDSSLYKTSTTTTGTVSKTNPASPTLTPTPTIQLGVSGSLNQIEQGATGSISFTSSSANPSNSWNLTSLTTNVTSPYLVTGSATGSTPISLTATANYASPSGDNIPDTTTTTTTTTTYNKIRSVRYGASTATAFTSTELENLATWDTTLGGAIGIIVKGTTNPHMYRFTIITSGQYIYIVVDSTYTLTGILNVNNSNSNDLGVFTPTTIGNYKVYRSNNISATTILYELRTS